MRVVRGKTLLEPFDRHLGRYAQEVEALERKIQEEETAISAANQRREDAYAQLAEFYCDERDRLKEELVAVSRQLQFQFDAKNRRRAEIEADLARWNQLIEQAVTELRQARNERDAAAAERDAAMARVEKELKADASFQEASALSAAAEQTLAAETAACAALHAEVRAKRTAYEKNPFFMYLVARAYGTTHYKARGLGRRGDAWLAKRVHWDENYPRYLLLKELSDQGDARVANASRVHQLAAARVTLRIQEAEQSNGATVAKQRLERRCHTVAEIEAQIGDRTGRRDALARERDALETNQDPFVKKAKEAIKAMLTSESLQALKARAQRTQAGRDAALVHAIERAETAVNSGRLAIKQLRQERNNADASRRRAEAARRQFSADYTDTYDVFDANIDLDTLLVGYLAGQTSEHRFWSAVDRHYHDETPQPAYSSSGSSDSSSISFGGGDSGGSSFSGGDSGGSSFGGGD